MSHQDETEKLDVFGPWRMFRDQSFDAWVKAMAGTTDSAAFAQMLRTYLDAYLSTAAPLQQAVEQYMQMVLPSLNVASREEISGLAKRLTNVEMRIDDLDAKLDQVLDAVQQPPASPVEQSTAMFTATLEARLQALDDKLTQLSQNIAPTETQERSEESTATPAQSKRRSRASRSNEPSS